MGRQIIDTITMSFSTIESVRYKNDKVPNPKKANFVIEKAHNTNEKMDKIYWLMRINSEAEWNLRI